MSFSLLFKYIVIGDQSVGKSCLVMQFIERTFKTESEATIGVEFASKTITLNSQLIKLQIWDTAGQQAFKSITRSYYRGTIGAIMVYDITSRQSFQNISKWLQQTKNYATTDSIVSVLVGNKIDCDMEREVSKEEGQAFAEANGLMFFECSAKQNKNVITIFESLTQEVLRKVQKGQIDINDENGGVRLGDYKRQAKEAPQKKCC